MRNIKSLFLAGTISIILYLLIFNFVVKKPLSLGFMFEAYQKKMAYAKKAKSPKVVIVAGCNGFFSHRCEVMEKIVGMPCVNVSTTAELSIDFQLAKAKEILFKGDIALLPIEYSTYTSDSKTIESSVANVYMTMYDKKMLRQYGWKRRINSSVYFNLKFLISALGEMGLRAAGVSRRFSMDTLTPQGDMKDHTEEKGRAYRKFMVSEDQPAPKKGFLQRKFQGELIVDDFLVWAKANGVMVVGSLPTVFNDYPVSDEVVQRIRDIYLERGHEFILLPNRSQYDRSCFYDTAYHLNERCQITHSISVAHALKKLLIEKNKILSGHK